MKSYKTEKECEYAEGMEQHLLKLAGQRPLSSLVADFAKYTRRQELTRFLVRHELYKEILPVKGSIVECGVHSGNGLMTWAQLAAILEPVGFFRRIYGFDTFEGFPSVAEKDRAGAAPEIRNGDLRSDSYEDLGECIRLFDKNRFLAQFPKVFLVKGDFLKTADKFLLENPHILIALLYLDFDLYEPTKKALELFLSRMPKGSILAFDEINNPDWPGETTALIESLDVRSLAIRKYPFEPNISYAVL